MNPDEPFDVDEILDNNSPLPELLHLTPLQANMLLSDAYNPDSPVGIRKKISDDSLDKIPLFRMVEVYLEIIAREKEVELTAAGGIPQKVLVEVYEKRFLPDPLIDQGVINLVEEDNCISVMSAGMIAEVGRLVKKVHNKQSLTKKGRRLMLPANRSELFAAFLYAFTNEFPWHILDAHGAPAITQIGWGFSILSLHKHGSIYRPITFYSRLFFKAFPHFMEEFDHRPVPVAYATACYYTRTVERFFVWLGMAILVENVPDAFGPIDTIKATPVLEEVFEFEEL